MQWSGAPYARFSGVEPWIRVVDNYEKVNVARQESEPDSVLVFWKRMIRVRRQYRYQLIRGRFQVHDRENLELFTYTKTGVENTGVEKTGAEKTGAEKTGVSTNEILLVVLNFGGDEADVVVPGDVDGSSMRLLMSTSPEHSLEVVSGRRFHPWEGRLYSCQRKEADV